MREATAVMRSKDLSEAQKESAIQKAAIRMFGSFFSILGRVILTLAVPVGFVMMGSWFGLYTAQDALLAAENPSFIIGSSIVMTGALFFVK